MAFKKATRTQSKLRLALLGPSGSGKTYTALSIARHLGQRVAVIDSERGSASLYAGDVCDFDVLELERFSPRDYVNAIHEAEREGYDVIVVDSLTHAWSGKGGALDQVEDARKRSRSQNSFAAWREVTPEHNALVDALVGCKSHLIATMRVKTAYELQEDDRGKKTPVKLGLAPVQRDGLEYEFTVVGDIDLEHVLTISKTRCAALDRGVFKRPGKDVADILHGWLSGAAPEPEKPAKRASKEEAEASARAAFPNATVTVEETKGGALIELMDTLNDANTQQDLTDFARLLMAAHGPVRGTDEWKSFQKRCAAVGVNPRDAVNGAQQ